MAAAHATGNIVRLGHPLYLFQEGAHLVVRGLRVDETQGTRYLPRYPPEERRRPPERDPGVLNPWSYTGV